MTKEVSPLSAGRISSRTPKSVRRPSSSEQPSARTSAVHSTTPSQSLCTLSPSAPVRLRQAGCGLVYGLFARDLLQRELVCRPVGVGRPRGRHLGQRAHRVAGTQVHYPNSLRGTPLLRDRVSVDADRRPVVRDYYQLVQPRPDHPHALELAALAVGLERYDALAAAALGAELREGRALAEALLRDHEQVGRVVVDDVHAEYHVALAKREPLDARGRPAHGPRVALGEADALAVAAHHDDVGAVRDLAHGDQLVVVGEVDRDDPVRLERRVVLQEVRLLDDAVAGGEEQVLGLVELLGGDDGLDPLPLREREQVGDVPPLGRPPHPRELVHLEPVHLAPVGEEEHVVVRRRDEEVVDVVALFELHPGDADPAASLLAERVDGDALQVAAVRDGDDHLLFGYEVLYLEVDALLGRDRRPAIVRVGPPDLAELLLDDPVDLGLVGQDALQVLDLLEQVPVLPIYLLALHSGEPLQAEVQDRLRLALGELEVLHQVVARRLHAARLPDGRHHLVEVEERDQQPLEDVRPRLRPLELVPRPAGDDLELVVDVVLEDRPVRERLRHAINEGHQVHAEALLHLGVLVEVVQDDLRHRLALELDDDPHPVAVRLVAQVAYVGELALLDELGDLLQQVALVDLVGDLGYHDLGPVALDLLGVSPGLDLYRPAPGRHRVLDAAQPDDHASRREVGPLDVLGDFLVVELGVLDECYGGVDDLAEVVRRDLGRHPHRDAVCTVDEQVRVPRRQHLGLALALVEVRDEVDGVRTYVPEHLRRHAREARLGVPHGGRRVAVDAAEVALAVHERVTHREALGEPGQRVVDGRVAVRVVLTDDLADYRGALAVGPVRL